MRLKADPEAEGRLLLRLKADPEAPPGRRRLRCDLRAVLFPRSTPEDSRAIPSPFPGSWSPTVCAAPGQGGLCAPHPVLSKSAFVLGENALGERLPQTPAFQSSSTPIPCCCWTLSCLVALGEPWQVTGVSPRAPARSTERGWTSRAASSCLPRVLPGTGESSPAQRLFKSGSKHDYLGAVNLPGASLALAPLMLPLGPETPRVQPGNASGGSGAPVQAGSNKCGKSCGNLSIHEDESKPGSDPSPAG